MANKYRCDIYIMGDGMATGSMLMTEEEYAFARKLFDPKAWDHADVERYAPNFWLECAELDEKRVRKEEAAKEASMPGVGADVMRLALQRALGK